MPSSPSSAASAAISIASTQGRLEEVVEHFHEQPGRHDQGGWSQARYQRHIEKLVHDHLKDVAETLDRQVRELGGPPLVIVASDETRAELEETLSHEVKKAIVGWTSADAHAGPAELLEDVEPLLESRHAEQETEAVEHWKEEAGRNGRAAAGWGPTLEAASDGRVELLLFQNGADRPAWECPACGRVGSEGGACPLDGTQMEERNEGTRPRRAPDARPRRHRLGAAPAPGSGARPGHRRAPALLSSRPSGEPRRGPSLQEYCS